MQETSPWNVHKGLALNLVDNLLPMVEHGVVVVSVNPGENLRICEFECVYLLVDIEFRTGLDWVEGFE